MSFNYVNTRLLVGDYKACFQFYNTVMGFEASFGSLDDFYAEFKAGTITIALFDRNAMSTVVGRGEAASAEGQKDRVALVFGVENVDEAYQQLTEKGVNFVNLPADQPDWGVRVAHFRDPDGNLIEINASLT